jgi:hypothetical protein
MKKLKNEMVRNGTKVEEKSEMELIQSACKNETIQLILIPRHCTLSKKTETGQ